jgi:hypothetical protein
LPLDPLQPAIHFAEAELSSLFSQRTDLTAKPLHFIGCGNWIAQDLLRVIVQPLDLRGDLFATGLITP